MGHDSWRGDLDTSPAVTSGVDDATPAWMKSRLARQPAGLQILIPATRRWFPALFLTFFLAALCRLGIGLLFQLAEDGPLLDKAFPATFLLLMTIFSCRTGFDLLWMLVGCETVLLGPSTLVLRRTVLNIGPTRTFRLDQISNLRTNPTGGLVFEYRSKTVCFAREVGLDEAEYLLGQLAPASSAQPD